MKATIITVLMDQTRQTTHANETIDYELYPLITGAERLAIFQEACGILKGREDELIAHVEKIRGEFERDLPLTS